MTASTSPDHHRAPNQDRLKPLRRRRRGLLSGLLGLVALLAMAIAAPSASADPWQCSAYGYLFQSPEGISGPHNVEQVDLATGEFSTLTSAEATVNAVGYNVLDNYMYGVSRTEIGPGEFESSLVRIEADGSFDELPWPAGIPQETSYFVGDVDAEGQYLLASGGVSYLIDLEPGSAEYGELIAEGEYGSPAGYGAPLDVAYIGGAFYGVAPTSPLSGAPTHLMRYTIGGAPEDLGALAGVPSEGAYGAVYADAAGYLYASNNATGLIYRIDPVSKESFLVSEGPTSSSNDGARCAAAPIPTVTITKTVGGRVRAADQFTVSLVTPKGKAVDSATTVGSNATATTTNFPVSQGQTYTITDAMAPGSPSSLAEYVESISCVDGVGNPAPVVGSGPTWALTIAGATAYTCNVTNRPEADVSIEKSSSPTPVVPGEEATFTLKVTNKGPSAAIGETVTDKLPAEFDFVSASPGCGEAGGTVTCAVGDLPPGGSQAFQITGEVASALDHCLENTATVSGTIDPDHSNNSATDCAPIEGRSDLSIDKRPSADSVPPGSQVIYTMVIRNHGPSDATGVKVTDPMAAGLALVAAKPSQGKCSTAGGQLACGLGYLAAGGSAQILVTTTATAPSGQIVNTAKVRGDQVDHKPENNQDPARITVVPGPPPPASDLVVKKHTNVKRPVLGQVVTYRIDVTNRGPAAASGVSFTDTLNIPARLLATDASAGKCSGHLPLRCELGTIAAGKRVTIKVRLRPYQVGCRKRNAASASGAVNDPNTANNMDVLGFCVRRAKLGLSKVASSQAIRAGQKFNYLIKVRNRSKGIARNVRVCDRLPSGLAYLGAKPNGKLRKGRRCWTVKRLGPRQAKSFRVFVRAARGAAGRKVNRVVANSPDAKRVRARSAVRIDAGGISPAAGGVTG